MAKAKQKPSAITTMEAPPDEIRGVVEILHCAKPGFSAGRLYSGSRVVSFSVKGLVKMGSPVTIRGHWENNPKWGRQFKGDEVVHSMPADAEGIEAWLKCYVIGLGLVKAKAAVRQFGVDLPRLMQENPEQVAVELRLPLEYVQKIAELWVTNSGEVNAMAALLGHGLTQAEAESLYDKFKGSAVTILEENPYMLLGEISGFGWARIDSLGVKLGIQPSDPKRLQAAFVEVVRVNLGEGSTSVPAEGMMNSAADLAGAMFIESGALPASLHDAIEAGRIVDLGGAYALPGPARIERSLWKVFAELRRGNLQVKPLSDRDLETLGTMRLDAETVVTLDETQSAALRMSSLSRGVVVTGGAGCGKTLIARAIHRMYAAADCSIALCAPTGKAARRLTQVLGVEATTIHRLLDYSGEFGGFTFDAKNLLQKDVIIVDEVSMCDASLLWSLLQAIGLNTSVVLIGDPNQLPPVGAGYPLRDILAHDLLPAAKLEKCHRQAGYLRRNSQEVLHGTIEPSVTEDHAVPPWIKQAALHDPALVLSAVTYLFAGNAKNPTAKLEEWGYRGLFDHQFMTAMHKGVLGTMAVNELLQRLHQKTLDVILPVRDISAERLPIMTGDKVIQIVNNYTTNVMNGTLGIVVDDRPLSVSFEGAEPIEISKENSGQLALAYCLTPHKMQGSQVPCAIVIVPKQHSFMQHRNWLYTAVTRAQRTAIVMGDSDGVRRAAERVDVDSRTTILQHFAERGHDGTGEQSSP